MDPETDPNAPPMPQGDPPPPDAAPPIDYTDAPVQGPTLVLTAPDATPPAVQAAKASVDQAQAAYDNAVAKVNWYNDQQPRTYDPKTGQTLTGTYSPQDKAQDEQALRNAADVLGRAQQGYASVLVRLSAQQKQQATKTADPAQQAAWTAAASASDARAGLYGAQASVIGAKTADDAAVAQARVQQLASAAAKNNLLAPAEAQAAIAHASAYASQATLANARAAQIAALTPSQIAKNEAQVQYYVQRGDLSEEQANQIRLLGPAKVAEFTALAQKNGAQAALAMQKATVPQPVNANPNEPTAVTRDPQTGALTGQPNPGYTGGQEQAILDERANAIKTIQAQIAAGTLTPGLADTLMQGIEAATQARLKGTTVAQYEQQQETIKENQKQQALNLLTTQAKAGSDMFDSLAGPAQHALESGTLSQSVPLGALFGATQQLSEAQYGGRDALDQARQTLSGLGPIQSPQDLQQHQQALQQAGQMLQHSGPDMPRPPTLPMGGDFTGPSLVDALMQGAGGGGDPQAQPQGLPSYAGGGQVPGPVGRPQLAVVHGGESIYDPTGGRGATDYRPPQQPTQGRQPTMPDQGFRPPQVPRVPNPQQPQQPGASGYVNNAQGLPPGLAMLLAQGRMPANAQGGRMPVATPGGGGTGAPPQGATGGAPLPAGGQAYPGGNTSGWIPQGPTGGAPMPTAAQAFLQGLAQAQRGFPQPTTNDDTTENDQGRPMASPAFART